MRSFFAEIYLYLTTKYPKKKIFGNDTQMQAEKKTKNDIIIVFMLYEKWWKIISIIKQNNIKKRE